MDNLKKLNKLWRTSTTTHPHSTEPVINKDVLVEDHSETDEEEEESFFELELLMGRDKENEDMCMSSNEANLRRKVVPLEPELKQQHPHSPISILKSAPKFKVSLFRKHTDLKLKANPKPIVDKEEYNCKATSTVISTLISQNCSSPASKPSKPSIIKTEEFQSDTSKRFSKEVMQKYLKPFHLKAAKRCTSVNMNTCNNKSRIFDLRECSVSSVSSTSSASSAFKVACKQLGKSRSASSVSSGCRRDESLMVVERDDSGIQSAILHCKRSFNSSRDSSVHSRSSSNSREQEPQLPNII